jgi:hypothetical protein
MRNLCIWLITASTLSAAGLGAAVLIPCAFSGAGGGAPLPFEVVQLPALNLAPGPGIPLVKRPSVWTPPTSQLLEGAVIVRTAAEMKDVWKRLFHTPYDASQFDFSTSFVVLMGGGMLPPGASFGIDCVEGVEATYADNGSPGPASETFLSITATTFLPGVQQEDPPPPAFQVSAVKISKSHFDDAVFHRRVTMGV